MSDALSSKNVPPMPPVPPEYADAVRIVARSFYRQLRSCGYTPRQLLALSTELIDLITRDLHDSGAP